MSDELNKIKNVILVGPQPVLSRHSTFLL